MYYQHKRFFFKLILILHLCTISSFCASFHAGPIECGAGSWIHFPIGRDAFSAYNKLSFDGYFSYGKLKGFIGFPFLYTLDKRDYLSVNGKRVPGDTILGKLAPGDLSSYIGLRIGKFEPRIGIIIPLGYSTKTGVWLGSKNIIIKTGTGFSGDIYKDWKLKFGGEIYFKYYIAGFPEIDDAQGKRGSWSIEPDLKVTIEPIKKWKFGMETLCGIRKFYPVWLKHGSFQGYELSLSVVPHFIMSYAMSSRIYLSGKAGFGPNFKSIVDSSPVDHPCKHSGYAANFGISAGFYP